MGRTPVPEPPPDQPPAPAIDHLFDGAADPAAEEPDLDLTDPEPERRERL
jgi:hypothetical protein